ncbi:MAG: hypothetical protein ACYC49_16025 [Ignavibacteriaceae bacterium]
MSDIGKDVLLSPGFVPTACTQWISQEHGRSGKVLARKPKRIKQASTKARMIR